MTPYQKLKSETTEAMKHSIGHTEKELHSIRTGRAQTSLVEDLMVDAYDTKTLMKQLGTISTPDPRSIVIQPWDKSIIGDIEKTILKSDIGITPTNDGKIIRLAIPPLTEERRAELSKFAHKICEDGKVSLRNVRREAIEKLKKLEDSSDITEDDLFDGKKEFQKLIDEYCKKIDDLQKAKEKELTGH